MSSSNPAFSESAIRNLKSSPVAINDRPATIQGTVNKTMFLLFVVVAVSTASWIFAPALLNIFLPLVVISAVVQLILTIIIVRNPLLAKNLSIVYAVIEGAVLGAFSNLMEMVFPGIVIQAILGTMGVVLGMLLIYKLRIIKVTENFRIMVFAATMGVAFIYVVELIMRAFGSSIPFVHEGSTTGIIFSLVVIAIAAFNLAIDFDFIEKCEEQGAPSHMEWYGAFGLMLTIIWLYIEILRLLSKSRRN